MTSNTGSIQLENYYGILASAALTNVLEPAQRVSVEFDKLSTNYSFTSTLPKVDRRIPAQFVFPAFDYTLPVMFELTSSTNQQELLLKFAVDEGVALVWQTNDQPTLKEDKVFFREANGGINITSDKPRAHFIAASLQSLLLLDSSATLQVPELQFQVNPHFPNSLAMVSKFLRRRQLTYRTMIIERAFGQELQIPSSISETEHTNIDFVYRAVTERSFLWPFWQDSFKFPANEQGYKLLNKIDGSFPFLIEIGSLQQSVFGRLLNLGPVNITVQNTALVSPEEVQRELQQLDGHIFLAGIKSLSGAAHYEFTKVPHLPDQLWDERIKKLVELESKLDDLFFEAVNQIAAASLDEETAREQENLLTDLSFDFSDDDDSISASKE